MVWQVGDPIPGFASAATGGAGGTEYTVTSGEDNGPGTLREFVENRTGTRRIRFDPTIRDVRLNPESRLILSDGNVTIDGSNAGGVQVRHGEFRPQGSNVIVAHMKFRRGDDLPGGTSTSEQDACQPGPLRGNIQSLLAMIHCEFSWGIDQTLSPTFQLEDSSFVNCLIAEGLQNSVHPKGAHSTGVLFFGDLSNGGVPTQITFKGNVLCFHWRRNPRFGDAHRIEWINNYVFSPGDFNSAFDMPDGADNDIDELFCGYNHYEQGPNSFDLEDAKFILDLNSGATLYVIGNKVTDQNGNLINGQHYQGAGSTVIESVPPWASGAHDTDISNLKTDLLAVVGAYETFRDESTQRLIDQCLNRTGGFVDFIGSDVANNDEWPTLAEFSSGLTLEPSLYTDPDTFFFIQIDISPLNLQTVSRAAVTDDPDTFFAPTVSTASVTQVYSRGPITDDDTFFDVTVTQTLDRTIEPDLFVLTNIFHRLTVQIASLKQDAWSSESSLPLVLLTISHPDLDEDINVVNNTQDIESGGTEYVAFPFEIRLPDSKEDAPPRTRLRIDNVSREIGQAIRTIFTPATVTLKVVRMDSPNTVEFQWDNLSLHNVTYNALTVEGELRSEELVSEPYPAYTYSPAEFPGIVR